VVGLGSPYAEYTLAGLADTSLVYKLDGNGRYCSGTNDISSPVGVNSGFAPRSPFLQALYTQAADNTITLIMAEAEGGPTLSLGGPVPTQDVVVTTRLRDFDGRDGRAVKILSINGQTPPGGYELATLDTGNHAFIAAATDSLFLTADFPNTPLTIQFEGGDAVKLVGPGRLAGGTFRPEIRPYCGDNNPNCQNDHTVLSLGFLNKFKGKGDILCCVCEGGGRV